jgi:hypothetical protein
VNDPRPRPLTELLPARNRAEADGSARTDSTSWGSLVRAQYRPFQPTERCANPRGCVGRRARSLTPRAD